MHNAPRLATRLLAFIVDHLDVPPSLYEKAAARHKSLGEWLGRPQSCLAVYSPDIRAQGSFRFGTVIRPLDEDEEYDLDNICLLTKLTKASMTQEQLKQLYGQEVKAYAKANGMHKPVEEHNRCWRLHYADEMSFHLDTLPAVPESADVVTRLLQMGVPEELATRAVGITDKRNPYYQTISELWLSSNPRGFARFFESKARLGLSRQFAEGIRATVEDVPPYEWKSSLQRSIQLLKRHRDVMFRNNRDLAPISMIITNLAAQAYQGEGDILDALNAILGKMGALVRSAYPRVPNPADPAEDYADKWRRDQRLEKNFWLWLAAARTDFAKLMDSVTLGSVEAEAERIMMVSLTSDELRMFEQPSRGPTIIVPTAAESLSYTPKPWGQV